jgi:predicted transcriptional regulator
MPTKLTPAHREALKRFRDEHTDPAGTLKTYVADFRHERKQIIEALRKAPATVPELASQTGFSAERVLWHVTAMRKYGAAVEIGPDGSYVKYAYIEQAKKKEKE